MRNEAGVSFAEVEGLAVALEAHTTPLSLHSLSLTQMDLECPVCFCRYCTTASNDPCTAPCGHTVRPVNSQSRVLFDGVPVKPPLVLGRSVASNAKVANRNVRGFGRAIAHAAVSRRPPIAL